MSTRENTGAAAPTIRGRADLLAVFENGCKPKAEWRIGTEHEKFVYRLSDHSAPAYDAPGGIRDVLKHMEAFGWKPIYEKDNVIALKGDDGNVSLEPAGQLELSGAPLDSLHDTCAETGRHLQQAKEVGAELGLGFLGLGMWPDKSREELPVMPKGRYGIMRRYMPTVGALGLDMMLRTCTIQTNLDYSSEADMVKKFRVSLALQPLGTALFANSPFTDGKPNGYLSYRSHIWTDTDPDRTGMLPFVFEDGFGFERWAEYMLDVPMYFAVRGDDYVDLAGKSFRDFMDGRLAELPGERPTADDWNDHLSTAFPEVRLKSFMEMRGADGGPWGRICALPALWVGLLYDQTSLDACADLIRDWTIDDLAIMRNDVPQHGLKTRAPINGRQGTLRDVGNEVLKIAEAGLVARRRLNTMGDNEAGFLAPLFEIVESGMTPADRLLEAYHGRWNGDVSKVYEEESF
ncbi:glutamate--cysteine ligase [Pacificimonas sp. WHA3]|uniref:Glutamate--cysteine ligase n=1 Tax=Pacificimonas pallii TaxID=2827236 RepID=A0ABS6SI89_9SPHN|nr:glutamate--cysteine ligase [Pacificimonas pallii]MBV7257641.1 glutamate--cysteine ligase [Pacificimonas pallii]